MSELKCKKCRGRIVTVNNGTDLFPKKPVFENNYNKITFIHISLIIFVNLFVMGIAGDLNVPDLLFFQLYSGVTGTIFLIISLMFNIKWAISKEVKINEYIDDIFWPCAKKLLSEMHCCDECGIVYTNQKLSKIINITEISTYLIEKLGSPLKINKKLMMEIML